MLHKETIQPNTLELLEKMMQIDELKDFSLLGGTSLALRWGHRISEDIDLFTNQSFDELAVTGAIENHFSNTIVLTQEKQTLRLFVENVKVELVAPKRPYLHPIETIENIRFFSVADTMAFKMNAIERRGSRKDFYDLYEALHYHDLTELIDFYCQKFSNHNPIHLIKSIIYFTDAENEPAFKSLKKTTWENIKQNIVKHHKNYLQSKI